MEVAAMSADLLARMVWTRHCDGRTYREVEPVVLVVDSRWQAKRLRVGPFHPAELIEAISPLGDDDQLIGLVSTGAFERFDPSTFERLPDGHARMVAVVGRDGSACTLGCIDGEDGPRVYSASGGGIYAAMVAAFVPAGELERELDLILAGA